MTYFKWYFIQLFVNDSMITCLRKFVQCITYYYVAIMTKIGSYEHDEMSTLAKSTLYNGEREGRKRKSEGERR